ncbi:MAG: hypothetical protein AAF170_15370 [Bacteroidota bacterium]
MPDPPRLPDAPEQSVTFAQALWPILFLLGLVVYGLILRPQVFDQPAFPLEVVFILAATFAVTELVILGHPWEAIQATIIRKLTQALPAFFIFFAIGLVIGSWMIAGTIPMLIVYGLKLIHPSVLYLSAFLVPVLFSTLTGTSWGSAGTVGVVVIGIAAALGDFLPALMSAVHVPSYAADVCLAADGAFLIELNPFVRATDGCLFNWNEPAGFDGRLRLRNGEKTEIFPLA